MQAEKTRPPRLRFLAAPEGAEISGLDEDGCFVLSDADWLRVGYMPSRCQITVAAPSIPISQASLLIVRVDIDGRWEAVDSGHNFWLWIHRAGQPIIRQPFGVGHLLQDGDVIESTFGKCPLGLRFVFEREY